MRPLQQMISASAAAMVVVSCSPPSTAPHSNPDIRRWASSRAAPLSDDAVREAVGSAVVVAAGEAAHGVEEALAFRNQSFKALAGKGGFSAIAMETGYAESRHIDEFIAGAPGDAADIARRYLTSGFGNFQANVDLIAWMRAYNDARGAAGRLRFIGVDLSLGGPMGSSATDAPIECALSVLERGARPDAAALRQAFSTDLKRLLQEQRPWTGGEFDRYGAFVRSLAASAKESGRADAIQCATVAHQAGEVQRVAPRPSAGGIPRDAWRTMEARDMAMAENVLWAMDQLGPNARLFVFAHNAHVMNAPQSGGHLSGLARPPRAMGQRLRERLGATLVIVAEAAPGSSASTPRDLGDLLRAAAPPPFLLDLRGMPADLHAWMMQPRSLRANGDSEALVSPASAFDVLVVQGQQSAARRSSRAGQ